jgi:signal transduction histidine kinase/DNA-binding NarL/FixJ family response regulator
MSTLENRRILLVDDQASIHEDFRKVLSSPASSTDLDADEALLFDPPKSAAPLVRFEMDSAFQGAEGLEMVRAAHLTGRPYAMAFIDMRMPPGWDGVETAERLWLEEPRLQLVFCTAYSDTPWAEVSTRLDARDRLLILKKPFDPIEVRQLASALTTKWQMTEQAAFKMSSLEEAVAERTRELEQSREMFRLMAESTNAVPFTLDLTHGCFTYIGVQGVAASGVPKDQWMQPGGLDIVIPRATNAEVRQRFEECASGLFEFVTALSLRNGARSEVRWTGTCESVSGAKVLRGLMLDVTELRRLGRELAAAQKLESVGRLAAGVAHEINTPVQFVSDNVHFMRTSMTEMAAVIQAYRILKNATRTSGDVAATVQLAEDAEKAADLDYILDNVPGALDSSIEGLDRIATIVRSMKEFAYPDQAHKTLADLNQAIRSTLIVAHNEYKYIAELSTEFGELPLVPCYLGEINQVVLNLLVNASHAISDVVKDSGSFGKLMVRTRLDGDVVEISVGDSGTGIPETARDKIFDPFFTTKEVGKGTGQGLAIARSVIVNKHGGTLRFETECGVGTTFFIRLPVDAPTADALQVVV